MHCVLKLLNFFTINIGYSQPKMTSDEWFNSCMFPWTQQTSTFQSLHKDGSPPELKFFSLLSLAGEADGPQFKRELMRGAFLRRSFFFGLINISLPALRRQFHQHRGCSVSAHQVAAFLAHLLGSCLGGKPKVFPTQAGPLLLGAHSVQSGDHACLASPFLSFLQPERPHPLSLNLC